MELKVVKPLFSLTAKDFRVDTFRSGGKGGQNQNKVSSGVRITHVVSGISAESREERDQLTNKRRAFEKLAKKPTFVAWIKNEAMRQAGDLARIKDEVERLMNEKNLKIETQVNGIWKTFDPQN